MDIWICVEDYGEGSLSTSMFRVLMDLIRTPSASRRCIVSSLSPPRSGSLTCSAGSDRGYERTRGPQAAWESGVGQVQTLDSQRTCRTVVLLSDADTLDQLTIVRTQDEQGGSQRHRLGVNKSRAFVVCGMCARSLEISIEVKPSCQNRVGPPRVPLCSSAAKFST